MKYVESFELSEDMKNSASKAAGMAFIAFGHKQIGRSGSHTLKFKIVEDEWKLRVSILLSHDELARDESITIDEDAEYTPFKIIIDCLDDIISELQESGIDLAMISMNCEQTVVRQDEKALVKVAAWNIKIYEKE